MTTLPPTVQHVTYQDASYTIAVSGPGTVRLHKAGKGLSTIALSGTTSASSVAITQGSTTDGYQGSLLAIAGITIGSGQLGQVLGGGALDLVGSIQSSGSIQSIQLGEVSPAATINAKGGLGSLVVTGDLHLGPHGRIHVAGDLSGGLEAGSVELTGGQIVVDHNLGSLTLGSLSVTANGTISVGNDAGAVKVSGDASIGQGGSIRVGEDASGLAFSQAFTLNPGGLIAVGRDLTGALTVNADMTVDGGSILIGRDAIGSVTVNGGLSASARGNLTVARDDPGGISVNGNLVLASGAYLSVGRNLGTASGSGSSGSSSSSGSGSGSGLIVGGNFSTAGGGSIVVGGNFAGFTVGGTLVGQGTAAVDVTVGLDLDNWTVLGGAPNQGGVINFNLSVGKDIAGMTILHGLFHDFVTAGVQITNVLVGPDGATAVLDSEIRAGVEITGATFSGDVISDRPTNPLGGLTRIVAGEDRAGNFGLGGSIDKLIIAGSLINGVVAAGVQPYGGDGTVQSTPASTPIGGDPGTYDAPLGGIYRAPNRGNANGGVPYAAPPFDTATDPNVQDRVLAGSINHTYAPGQATGTTIITVYPSTSTVDGAVLTTGHANGSDYAGIFAEDTRGVFVGTPPSS